MNWNEIIKFLISASGVSAIIIYIGKKLVDKSLDASIEKYKTQLSKELELYKSDLSRVNTEHQIKYNRLHEQRGEKVKELYQLIYELEKKLKHLTSPFQGPEWPTETERSESVKTHLFELEDTLELNRIYFNDDLSKKIESIIKESRNILSMIFKAKLIQKHNDDLNTRNNHHLVDNPHEPLDTWVEAESFVQNEIKQARMDLINEFHVIIGVQ